MAAPQPREDSQATRGPPGGLRVDPGASEVAPAAGRTPHTPFGSPTTTSLDPRRRSRPPLAGASPAHVLERLNGVVRCSGSRVTGEGGNKTAAAGVPDRGGPKTCPGSDGAWPGHP